MEPGKNPANNEEKPFNPKLRIVGADESGPGEVNPDVPQISLEHIVAIASFRKKAMLLRKEFEKEYRKRMAEEMGKIVETLPVKKRFILFGRKYVEIKGRFFRGKHLEIANNVLDSIPYPGWLSHVEEHAAEYTAVSSRIGSMERAAGYLKAYLEGAGSQEPPPSGMAVGVPERDFGDYAGSVFETAREYEKAACEIASKLPDCSEGKPSGEEMAKLEARVSDVNRLLAQAGSASCAEDVPGDMQELPEAVKEIHSVCKGGLSPFSPFADIADLSKISWRSRDFGEFLQNKLGFDVKFVEFGIYREIPLGRYTFAKTRLPQGFRAAYAWKYLE